MRTEKGIAIDPDSQTGRMMQYRTENDTCVADINNRVLKKNTMFTCPICWDSRVMTTVTSGATCYRGYDGQKFSDMDFVNVQTFPQDYDFMDQSPQYVCGMSVPPVMEAQIAHQIELLWFKR